MLGKQDHYWVNWLSVKFCLTESSLLSFSKCITRNLHLSNDIHQYSCRNLTSYFSKLNFSNTVKTPYISPPPVYAHTVLNFIITPFISSWSYIRDMSFLLSKCRKQQQEAIKTSLLSVILFNLLNLFLNSALLFLKP